MYPTETDTDAFLNLRFLLAIFVFPSTGGTTVINMMRSHKHGYQRGKGWGRDEEFGISMYVHCVWTQLCPIPCDPMVHQAPLTMEFSRQEC